MSHLRGVNAFAALPAFGGKFDEEVAQQRGHRTPTASREEKGAHSGLRLAVVDPDATVTAPGGASSGKVEDANRGTSEVSRNADMSGEVLVERLGDCPRSPIDTQDLVANAGGMRGQVRVGSWFPSLRPPRRCA